MLRCGFPMVLQSINRSVGVLTRMLFPHCCWRLVCSWMVRASLCLAPWPCLCLSLGLRLPLCPLFWCCVDHFRMFFWGDWLCSCVYWYHMLHLVWVSLLCPVVGRLKPCATQRLLVNVVLKYIIKTTIWSSSYLEASSYGGNNVWQKNRTDQLRYPTGADQVKWGYPATHHNHRQLNTKHEFGTSALAHNPIWTTIYSIERDQIK